MIRDASRTRSISYGFFLGLLILQIGLSLSLRPQQAHWDNVPPAPSAHGAGALGLGDRQLSYRIMGIMMQNLGDTGGRAATFTNYDYNGLGRWFSLADELDSRSDYMPLLAAYYFGATKVKSDLDPVIDYLAAVGSQNEGQKWRWLAQAVYLARFGQDDLPKALGLAEKLASLWEPGRPGWMKQMPVFILAAQGDRDSAYRIMMSILREEAETMDPREVNFMVDYICTRILEPAEAARDQLCVGRSSGG